MEHDLKRQRRFNFWFMLISVLLHALFFWFLFFLKHYNDKAFAMFDEQKKQEMLAGATEQASPASVVFEDEPQPEIPAQKPMEWTTGGLKQPDAQVEPKQEDEQPAALPQEVKPEQAIEETETTDIQKTEVQEQASSEPHAQEPELLPTTVANDQFAERIIEKKETKKPSQAPKTQSAEKLTLATLARGLLNKIQEKGDHLVTMVGDKKGNPTAEQLKYERYFQKIDASLKNAMRIHRYKFEDIARSMNSLNATCVVYVNLQRNGRAKAITVATSTTIRTLDDFLLFLVSEASAGFPPVPKYINEDPLVFSIHFPIEIVKDNRTFAFHR